MELDRNLSGILCLLYFPHKIMSSLGVSFISVTRLPSQCLLPVVAQLWVMVIDTWWIHGQMDG